MNRISRRAIRSMVISAVAMGCFVPGAFATPGAPTITSAPSSLINDPAWSVSFSGDSGADFECRVAHGSNAGSWADCTSPYEASGTDSDATYTFYVRQFFSRGDAGPAASTTFTLDTTAPDPPSLSGAPEDPVSSTSASISISGESGATFSCSLDSGTYGPCTSPYIATGLTDGEHTLSVKQIDGAGNESDPQSVTWTVDTTGPEAAVISPVTSPGRDEWFGLEFTTPDGGTLLECAIGESPAAEDWSLCSSPYSPNDGWPEGDLTFNIRATDSAGNVGAVASTSFTTDYTAPTKPTITPISTPTNDSSVPVEFEVSTDTEVVKCTTVSSPSPSDWVDCTSPYLPEGGWADGSHTVRVRAFDLAGNFSSNATVTFVVDTAAPNAPTLVSGPSGTISEPAPTVTFSGETNATFQCSLDSAEATSCASPLSLSALEDGAHTLDITQTDLAGNTSEALHLEWTLDTAVVDTTPPDAPVWVTHTSGATNNPFWDFSWTGEEGATSECRLDYWGNIGDWIPCTSPQATTESYPDGNYAFSVRLVDAAGNTSESITSSFTIDTVAPDAPVWVAHVSGLTNNPLWTFSWTGEEGATSECRIDTNGANGDWTPCSSPQVETEPYADGSYAFSVRVSDAAGNISEATTSEFTIDTVAPPVPSLDGLPTAVTLASTATATFSDTEPGVTFQCRLNLFGTIGSCSSPWNITGLNAGVKTAYVRARDAAGNVSAWASKTWSVRNPCGTPFLRNPIYKDLGKGNVQIRPFASPADVRAACQLLTAQVWTGPTKPLNSDHLTNTPSFAMKIVKYSSLIKISGGKTFVPKWIRVENKVGTWSNWYQLGKTR